MKNAPISNRIEIKVDNSSETHDYYVRCGKKVGIMKSLFVEEMHELAKECKEKGKEVFFAAMMDCE